MCVNSWYTVGSSYWLNLAKYPMRKLCCTADESRGGEEEGSTIRLIYRLRHSCKTALIYNYPRKIKTPKSLHRNHISTNPKHSHRTTFFHDEKSIPPPNPRPPKASITTSTSPKAFHINININSSVQETTNHRPKPRALPPLSEPPVPRPVRTCFLYTRPYITRLRTQ